MNKIITFSRLTQIAPRLIARHMSNPKVAQHMPLLTGDWDDTTVAEFVAAKEACWKRDGLGHWAILCDGHYIGWGGFQREGEEWDFGLVLRPDAFGLGMQITKQAIEFAIADQRIPYVTFLLPPSRKNLRALQRMGAQYCGMINYEGADFRKYRLVTSENLNDQD